MYGIRAPTTKDGQQADCRCMKLRPTGIIESIAEVDETTAQDPPLVHRRIIPCLHEANCFVLPGRRRAARLEVVRCPWGLCSGLGLLVKVGIIALARLDRLEFHVWQHPNVRLLAGFLVCRTGVRGNSGLDVEHAVEAGGRHDGVEIERTAVALVMI